MSELLASIKKELLLLLRDPGGLAVLYIMPIMLVLVVTVVQDDSYTNLSSTKIPLVLVDLDKGSVAKQVHESIASSQSFELVPAESEDHARTQVREGNAQLAIVLPQGLSAGLEKRIQQSVDQVMNELAEKP